MSLYRIRGVWYINLPAKTGRYRRSTGTTDKKEAQEFHDEIKARLWRLEKLGQRVVTWEQAVEKWLSIKPRGLPDRYRLRALSISPSTSIPLPLDLMENLLSGMAAGSYNRCISLVTAVHNTSGIEPPKIKRKPNPQGRTRWLSAEEWKKLKKALEKESPLLAQAAEFTLNTGLRENNVLNLEWSQVDLRRRVAWIHGDQAKAGEPIGVPLNERTMAILGDRHGIDDRLVFGNPDYALYKASNRAWYAALVSSKLVGFRWHDLRHTWASWAVMSGVRLEELMRLGGWKTPSMVARYAHLSSEHLADSAAKIKPISRKHSLKTVKKGG